MRARAEWVSTSSTDGAYVIPADAGTSAIGEFRLWRSRIESGMTQGPDSTGGSRANFRCGQRVPTVEPSKAAALATGANMIKEDPGRRRERVQPSVVESASHIRSPGRSRTFFANPDSKSGGPCRKTNRGSMPHSTSPARTTASRRDWRADPRGARLGGCHPRQLQPDALGACVCG